MEGINIYLIGMSGSGKSTVSPLLAESLGYRFVDTDTAIEKLVGQSVAEIFQTSGEPEWINGRSRNSTGAAELFQHQ
jgi:shikimate kinase